MRQLLITELHDIVIEQLQRRARERNTTVEALARDAIRAAAQLSVEEKRDLVRRMHARSRIAMVPGVDQTPGWILIREDRDHGH